MEIGGVEIKWLGHSGFLIKTDKIIYIDPYNISVDAEKADFILLTHSHYDHCSIVDINKIVKGGTKIILPADCQSKITRFDVPIDIRVVESEEELTFGRINLSVLPAYNIDKPFHQKEDGGVGYLIKLNGIIVYHAGDTDVIPEMQRLTGYNRADKEFIALLPIGGRFTMTVDEAVEAAKLIRPSLVVPMHYGSIVGNLNDAQEFIDFCKEEGINAKILEKE
jgi:L-ascorbate metabolism protein UlaG (beta-lactamase superfamily)